MGCSTKCALLRRSGAVSLASGRLTDQHHAGTRRAPPIHQESTSGSGKQRNALRRRSAAAIERLEFPFSHRAARVPLQPSNCCHHLVIPPQSRNGDCPHIAEGRQENLEKPTARYRDERQQRADKLTSLSTECCNEGWVASSFPYPLESILTRRAAGRGLRGRTK